jgi:hypothetical protein
MRKACIGSLRAARCAGTNDAAAATVSNASETPAAAGA